MKGWSVKRKLSAWISGFAALCLLLALLMLLAGTRETLYEKARASMEDAARDAADEVEYDAFGNLDIDEDIVYYQDGVTVVVLGPDGAVVAGRLPLTCPWDLPIDRNVLREAQGWLVWEVACDEPSLTVRAVFPRGETDATMARLAFTAAGVYLMLMVVLAGGSYWIARRAFDPVDRINRALGEIRGSEDLKRRLPDARNAQEFQALSGHLNQMLARMEDAFAAEKRFSADASHELRTPLGILQSQCEYALSRPEDAAAAQAALDVCLEEVRRMSALVRQLLLIARADSGRLKLTREPVALNELAEVTLEDFRERAAARGISLKSELAPDATVMGDETMLLMVLSNLIDNALKYHLSEGEGRFVCLAVHAEGASMTVEVRDNGRGIPPDQLASIWERFHRVDPVRDRGEGSGLGLSIVKWIVEAHGGAWSAESILGQGTRFTVKIPL